MIFIYLFAYNQACSVISEYQSQYPVIGEHFVLPMTQFFTGKDLIYECIECPENVNINNFMNDLSTLELQEDIIWKSLSSNNTHFALLSNDNYLYLYQWYANTIKFIFNFSIEHELICQNVHICLNNQILLECYKNQTLQLYNLTNEELFLVYEQNSTIPKSSQFGSFISEENQFLVFAQYFENDNDSSLYLFQLDEEFSNLYKVDYECNQFQISQNQGFQVVIYLVKNNQIQAFGLKNQEFQLLGEDFIGETGIQLYLFSSSQYASQCDQLYIISASEYSQQIGCADTFVSTQSSITFNSKLGQIRQFFANDEFQVFLQDDHLTISSAENPNIQFNKRISYQQNSLIYYDVQSNRLFVFSSKISVFQVSLPSIEGLFDHQISLPQFKIKAKNHQKEKQCSIDLNIKILEQNDTNLYVIYQVANNNTYLTNAFHLELTVQSISGSLLQISSIIDQNIEIGYFQDVTFYQMYQLNLTFYIQKMLALDELLLIAIDQSQTVYAILLESFTFSQVLQYVYLNTTEFVQDIQIAYYFSDYNSYNLFISLAYETRLTVINLQTNLFTFNLISIRNYSNVPYSAYLLSYSTIIFLIQHTAVVVQDYEENIRYTLDQKEIASIFGNKFIFDPLSIVMDQQYQSSIIFINNKNSIIICKQAKNQQLMPLNYIKVNFQIEQIFIVSDYLILLYNCHEFSLLKVCFQVYNVQNLYTPYFTKNLTSLTYKSKVNYYNDNNFFYVKADNNLLIFNPNILQHQSLYMNITCDSDNISFASRRKYSILLINNIAYTLIPQFTFVYKFNQNYSSYNYLDLITYYFSITSIYNLSQIYDTNPRSLTVVNNLLRIEIESLYFDMDFSEQIIYKFTKENLTVQGQILYYQISPINEKDKNRIKNFSNPISLINSYINHNCFTLISQIQNQFVVQNISAIQFFESSISLNYGQLYDYCYETINYNNSIYSFCQKNSTFYLIKVSLNKTEDSLYIEYQFEMKQSQIIFSVPPQIFTDNIFFLCSNSSVTIYNLVTSQFVILKDCECFNFEVVNIEDKEGFTSYLVLQLCSNAENEILYKVVIINKTTNEIQVEQKTNSLLLAELYTSQFSEVTINQMMLLKNYEQKIQLLLGSTEQISFIIIVNYFFGKDDKHDIKLQLFSLVQTIPAYDSNSLMQTGEVLYSKNILVFIYQNLKIYDQYLIIAYNLNDINFNNNQQALTPLGGYVIPQEFENFIYDFSFYVDENQQGQILILLANQIYQLSLSKLYFEIQVPYTSQINIIEFNLSASNTFYTNCTTISFNYSDQNIWSYILLSFTLLVLIFSLLFCWKKQRKPSKSESHYQYFEL